MTSPDELIEQVRQRLEQAVPAREALLRPTVLVELAARSVALTDGEVDTDALLVQALIRAAAESVTSLGQLEARRLELAKTYEAAETPERQRQVVRDQLGDFTADRVKLAGDLAATRRWLDLDALLGRLIAQASDHIDQLQMAYAASCSLVVDMDEDVLLTMDTDVVLELCFQHIVASDNETVRVQVLRFVTMLVGRFRSDERLMTLAPSRLRRGVEWARDGSESVWVRVAALELAVVTVPRDGISLLAEQLGQREGRDGMIVRNNALRLLAAASVDGKERLELAERSRDDPSEHVRQGLARALRRIELPAAATALGRLCLEDEADRVRAYALRELATRARDDLAATRVIEEVLLTVLDRAAGGEGTEPVERLEAEMALGQLQLLACGPDAVLAAPTFVAPLGCVLAAARIEPDLLEQAAFLLATFEVHEDPALSELHQRLAETLMDLREGRGQVVEVFPETALEDAEKALLVAARGDFPVSLQPLGPGRFRVTRGERRGLRLWRLLFELRNPAPDKRQAFSHTSARVPSGTSVVARPGMGEVTPTRVPGERRWLGAVRGWGEFLPLVDDLLAAAQLRNSLRRIVTSFGTLVIRGPSNPFRRLLCRLWLSLRYATFAAARDRALQARDPHDRQAFAVEIRRMGFELALHRSVGTIGDRPYEVESPVLPRYLGEEPRDSSAAALPLWIEGVVDALVSPTGNTGWHLAIVVWLAFCAMVIRGAWVRSRIEAAHRRIPLSIGGWGSRGKSGTERIKCALLHALRYDVVVKTTGCEAMLIHARRDLPAHELFVYRPYDKATIWEQHKVYHHAAQLGAQVFLWECMALRPQFVQVLQQEWMLSAITTLTNAYPDHEDVMGPSGEDVARVIATFMPPRGGVVITAEEQMVPVIAEEATRLDNELHVVSSLDAELLPADMLERFPYAEHPKNIAMVLALAEHLGVDREWALCKMADFVVPDLGVLKTYPTVPYRGRTLTFCNGMSANERAGFMSNWTRLGFDQIDADEHAESVIVAVVNNRADRVPRSRVFAELLTRDVVADLMVLLGTNLPGLQQFLTESLDAWLATLTLGKGSAEDARHELQELFRRLRVPLRLDTLTRRIKLVLRAASLSDEVVGRILTHEELTGAAEHDGAALAVLLEEACAPVSQEGNQDDLGLETGAVVDHVMRLVDSYRRAARAKSEIDRALERDDRHAAEQLMRACFREQWLARIHVVADSHSKGDAIIEQIARALPPGHHGRLLGCQNIKGTGLDFAYRWVSTGKVVGALERLEAEPGARGEALRILATHGDYGLIDALFACATVRRLRQQGGADWASMEADLRALEHQLATTIEQKRSQLGGPTKRARWTRVIGWLEPWVDHLDSIRRQRSAKRVMEDLIANRVSQARAALLLREVTARGKGGWAAKDVERWLRRRPRED